ncbi:PD-(D/E)XK nuclease family protein [Candidatus Pacearchaeota archaeon]|nr:PD-(D/E)XK nuclease family protein [Candidatus Pacearchaeota archaeon]
MATYSHSKVSTFENCPFQYKLKYIDKIKVETPTTIEAFMGDIVHQTLEKLYKDKKFEKETSKAILLKFYNDLWKKEYSDDIRIVKKDLTSENYKKMGIKFIEDYYDSHKDDDMTILGLETQDRMTLPDGSQWHVRIDKLGCKGDTYFVCDYKTNARMKDQEEADSDRQLAMYSFWVKDKFKDAKKVILKWHMLAFNKEVTSERTDEQLKKLQQDVISVIKEIEKAEKKEDFPRKQTGLCNYCVYKELCPSFKHQTQLENLPIEKFKKDDGVKLVDEYSEIKTKISELDKKKEEFEDKLIKFSKQIGIDAIYGSNNIAKIKEFEKIILPEEKEEFLALLREKGVYDACSMVCYPKLQSKYFKGELHKDIHDKITKEKDWRISLSKRDDLNEGE